MNAFLVAGLAFGDEGKGTIVDTLVRRTQASLVVRYNGGPQAAHHVLSDHGAVHCFSQFGAGTFAGAATHLSRFMLVDPLALMRERDALREVLTLDGQRGDPLDRLTIDPRCVVVTPYHRAANHIRELLRGDVRHGSCGVGVGEAQADALAGDALHIADLSDRALTMDRLRALQAAKIQSFQARAQHLNFDHARVQAAWGLLHSDPAEWARRYHEIQCYLRRSETFHTDGPIIFEGAQGVLLDQDFGFHPYTTWSNCTFANAETLIQERDPHASVTRVGVVRTYLTRHGAGPFPTNDPHLLKQLPESHNGTHAWQGAFRVGAFDFRLAAYARRVIGPLDLIAVTHCDRFPCRAAHGYLNDDTIASHLEHPAPLNEELTQQLVRAVVPRYRFYLEATFLTELERTFDAPVGLLSHGPRASDKEVLEVRC